jgi:hypothetical protein
LFGSEHKLQSKLHVFQQLTASHNPPGWTAVKVDAAVMNAGLANGAHE